MEVAIEDRWFLDMTSTYIFFCKSTKRTNSHEVVKLIRIFLPQRLSNAAGRGKRFTFQSTVRQLERRRLAEKLSKEADLKEQQRKTELEAMRR